MTSSGPVEGLTFAPYYPFWPYYGYFDLGPTQIPPFPTRLGMIDRTTGKVWYLASDATQSNRLVLIDTLSTAYDKASSRVYTFQDGPYFVGPDDTVYRVGVNNGRVVVDIVGPARTLALPSQTPIWARDLSVVTLIYYLTLAANFSVTNPHFGSALYPKTTPQQGWIVP